MTSRLIIFCDGGIGNRINALISKDTLILVDDSPSCAHFFFEEGFIKMASNQKIGGKGKYVASYMENIGNKAVIQAYQAAWIGM